MKDKPSLSMILDENKILQARIAELEQENLRLKQQLGSALGSNRDKNIMDVVFKSTPVGVGISRLSSGEFLYVNDRCAEILRIRAQDLIGRSSIEFYADLTQREKLVETFLRDGLISNEEVHFRRVDGTPYSCLLTWHHINFDDEDCVLFWVYDVDPLKKAQSALQHAVDEIETLYTINRQLIEAKNLRQLLKALVENIPIPVINRAVVFAMNYEDDVIVSITAVTNWYSGVGREPTAIGSNYAINYQSQFLQFLIGKAPVFFDDMQNDERVDDESYQNAVHLQIHALGVFPLVVRNHHLGVLLLQGQEPYAFAQKQLRLYQSMIGQLAASIENRLLFAQMEQKVTERTAELLTTNLQLQQEVGERKKAEAKLTNYTIELERSNRELQDFAYLSSHDLQEPLRKIQTFSDRLQSKYGDALDARGMDYLVRIQKAAGRMQNLIQALLFFSRVTSEASPFVLVQLNDVLDGVLEDLVLQIETQKGKVFVAELPAIEADVYQMQQLFQNLISNGLKYCKRDVSPVIQITTSVADEIEDGFCRITVSDNGVGFEEQYSERIFQVFQRLHSRQEYDGTGVGLAVCRRIIERHNGRIMAHSQPDEGATFIIELPFKHESA